MLPSPRVSPLLLQRSDSLLPPWLSNFKDFPPFVALSSTFPNRIELIPDLLSLMPLVPSWPAAEPLSPNVPRRLPPSSLSRLLVSAWWPVQPPPLRFQRRYFSFYLRWFEPPFLRSEISVLAPMPPTPSEIKTLPSSPLFWFFQIFRF